MRKSADLKKTICWCMSPPISMSHQPISKKENRPIPTDFGIGGHRWESVGKIVWCELDLIQRRYMYYDKNTEEAV